MYDPSRPSTPNRSQYGEDVDVAKLRQETIEYWIKLYWKSMMTLEDYFIKKPYSKPEALIFESVPKEIIQECEE